MNALKLSIIHQWVICILLIDSVASFNFNPHTKTEIPGIEKIKIFIKVNSQLLGTYTASFFVVKERSFCMALVLYICKILSFLRVILCFCFSPRLSINLLAR